MDNPTTRISEYVKATGINVSNMSRSTGIPYVSLYDSLLNDARDRDLRAGEFVKICNFLQISPMKFVDNPNDSF